MLRVLSCALRPSAARAVRSAARPLSSAAPEMFCMQVLHCNALFYPVSLYPDLYLNVRLQCEQTENNTGCTSVGVCGKEYAIYHISLPHLLI